MIKNLGQICHVTFVMVCRMLELEISTGFCSGGRPMGTGPVAAGSLAFLVPTVGANDLRTLLSLPDTAGQRRFLPSLMDWF